MEMDSGFRLQFDCRFQAFSFNFSSGVSSDMGFASNGSDMVADSLMGLVCDFIGLAELYYAGSHGMDIKRPIKGSKHKEGSSILFQPAREYLPMIYDEVFKQLVERTKSNFGAKVENNKFCVSVHFQRVEEKVGRNCKFFQWVDDEICARGMVLIPE
ncbi:hypothetical protein SO802_025186 [Lithocarpus litseifolius]|uniref:Uncharacterized protein n=1 Tax=Lithocarpus litseifolius TaxID=425828 RepID=A0AAW2BWE8_9ROSI